VIGYTTNERSDTDNNNSSGGYFGLFHSSSVNGKNQGFCGEVCGPNVAETHRKRGQTRVKEGKKKGMTSDHVLTTQHTSTKPYKFEGLRKGKRKNVIRRTRRFDNIYLDLDLSLNNKPQRIL
jgi:hypothetical protein